MSNIDKLKAMSDEERFLKNICPFCGEKGLDYKVALRGKDHVFEQNIGFQVLSCGYCNGLFTKGSDFQNLRDYYEKSYPPEYYTVVCGGRSGDAGSNPLLRKIILECIEEPSKARVLDVGCGNGGFLNYLREKEFKVFGVEVSKLACEYCEKEYGIKVFNGMIEKLPIDRPFQIITMVGTIEHFLNPVRTLNTIRQHLSPEGFLIFDFPDINSFEARLARSRWWALELPRHTLHFTKESARRIIEITGFRLVRSISIAKTWFHPGFLTPPVRDGFSRRSIPGMAVQMVSLILLLLHTKPHHIYVCKLNE